MSPDSGLVFAVPANMAPMERVQERGLVPSDTPAWQLEWRAIRVARANALIIASACAADELVDHARTFLPTPIHECSCAEGLSLPAGANTVILRDVDALGPEDQSVLLRWLVLRARPVQLLSVCETPLFPLVERAGFLEPLYYRLNVITIVHSSVTVY
jgi:transcriptional regulator of aromatic amino acid metabolism